MGLHNLPLILLLYLQNAFPGFLQQIISMKATFLLFSEMWTEAEEGKRYSGGTTGSQVYGTRQDVIKRS